MAGFFGKIFSAVKGFFTGSKTSPQGTEASPQPTEPIIHHRTEDPEPMIFGSKVRTKIGMAQWAESGLWATVESSYVQAIKYDQSKHELHVRFATATCRYSNITLEFAHEMFQSPSMGQFVRSKLWKIKPYSKV